MNKKAFTLVELIVSIAILAILWTIAFISLQWYSKTARDSVRISDLSLIKTGLEIFHIDWWKYPLTTNWYDVTYWSWKVWKQWIFWESTFKNVDKLDKIPRDPLLEKEYTYSVLNNKQEYELAWVMEWESLTLNNKLLDIANAEEQTISVMVTWNYNGEMLETTKSWTTCIVAMPSIITSTWTTLEVIIPNNYLVYDTYKNLPSNYKTTKFELLWEIDFKIVNEDIDLYCWDLSELETDEAKRIEFVDNIQKAYTGTQVEVVWRLKEILDLTIDTSNPSTDLKLYTIDLVEWELDTTISDEQKEAVYNCNTWYHDEWWICINNIWVCTITNGLWLNTWNWNSWDCTVSACDTDFYNSWNNSCSSVWIWFYSDSTSTIRSECTNKLTGSMYTSAGNWLNDCSYSFSCDGKSCYTDSAAKNAGYAINTDGTPISYDWTYWSKTSDSNSLIITWNTYINKSSSNIIAYNSPTSLYYSSWYTARNYSNAVSLCSSKWMRLPTANESSIGDNSKIPSSGQWTWTSSPPSRRGLSSMYAHVHWSGTSLSTYGDYDSMSFYVRCVK